MWVAAVERAPPMAGSDEALVALLRSCALSHLQEPLAHSSLAACTVKLEAEGRTGQYWRALGIEPSDMQLQKGPVDRLVATLSTPRGLVEF